MKGQNLDFAPSSARFAKVCRDMQAALDYSRRPQAKDRRGGLEYFTDEHRAEMQRRFGELRKSLAAQG